MNILSSYKKFQIAVGASDSVMIIKNGALKYTLKVERKEKRLPTIVWSLCFVKDIVLASGDSRGVVSFWNFDTGSLLGVCLLSYITNKLVIIDSVYFFSGIFNFLKCYLYAAGVDPRIIAIKEIVSDSIIYIYIKYNILKSF
uniref:WD_REPEATS_REGION domain-containing protein n=1 Tax=Heterorhabditis bacteriophora TaxID=37862 RepID=A0A1I7WKM0_HETBA